MKAVRNPDGSASLCTFVYTGGTSIFGVRNRYFFTGRFSSVSSQPGEIQRSQSDAGSMAGMVD